MIGAVAGIDPTDPWVQAGAYLLLFMMTLAAMALGCLIAFQAYRGYRRHGLRPMFYLAIGFVFLTVVPFLLSILFTTVGAQLGAGDFTFRYGLPIASRLMELLGLSCILHSLYMQRD